MYWQVRQKVIKSYVAMGLKQILKIKSTRVFRILARAWKDKMLTDEPFILAAGELYQVRQ